MHGDATARFGQDSDPGQVWKQFECGRGDLDRVHDQDGVLQAPRRRRGLAGCGLWGRGAVWQADVVDGR